MGSQRVNGTANSTRGREPSVRIVFCDVVKGALKMIHRPCRIN